MRGNGGRSPAAAFRAVLYCGKDTAVALEIQLRQFGDIVIVYLTGRATIGLGNDLLNAKLRQVVESGAKKILVNLSGLAQIDSSGISSIVRTFVTLERTGGTLKLLNAEGRVKEVLTVTRLLAAIPNFEDENKALASFH
jgi:anti-anti-sigma factor